ncbi:MAG: hypothetical protein ACK57I_05935, partial [Akkermansiaceae bacterium]
FGLIVFWFHGRCWLNGHILTQCFKSDIPFEAGQINRKDHKEHKEGNKCRVIGGIPESRALGRLRSEVSVDN